MSKLIQQIQRIVQNAIEAKKLTDSMIGTIESVNPFQLRIDERLMVDKDFLTFLSYVKIDYLEKGDKLLLLRVQNGNHFIVLDKV